MNTLPGQRVCNVNIRYKTLKLKKNNNLRLPNIDYMMNITKNFLSGKIDGTSYSLDFSYELEKRYNKMNKEGDDYSCLIYKDLYEMG